MHFTLTTTTTTTLLLFSTLVLAVPQYGAPPDSSTPTAASSTTTAAAVPSPSIANQQIVQVFPNNMFVFQPNNIIAKENDTITFIIPDGPFLHSITQSSFALPCNLLNENGGGQLGFDSSLQKNAQFSLVITNASQPIWFFCKQFGPPSHCGSGMVGAINAPTSGPNTFDNFQTAAQKLGSSQPQDTHSGGLVGLGASATAPAGPISSGSSGSGNSTSGSGGSGGAIQLTAGGMSLFASLALAFTLL